MVKDDKYSDKEFDSKKEMHLYWAENHMDELNSHDKEKAKKALREKKNEKSEKIEWRKKMLLRGVAGLVLVGLVAVSIGPIMSMISGGATIDYDKLNLSEQPMLGSEDASVTVVEFGDYLCSHCRSFDQEVKPQLQDLIDSGDVNFYFMDRNVITPIGGSSGTASVSAQCVYQQSEEEFWDYHSALFDRQNQIGYNTKSLVDLAEQNTEGLNYTELEACISNRETVESVQQDNSIGTEVGATSTPSVYVNGRKISNWNNLVSYIENNHL
jgi:protein-disulfide isomerase